MLQESYLQLERVLWTDLKLLCRIIRYRTEAPVQMEAPDQPEHRVQRAQPEQTRTMLPDIHMKSFLCWSLSMSISMWRRIIRMFPMFVLRIKTVSIRPEKELILSRRPGDFSMSNTRIKKPDVWRADIYSRCLNRGPMAEHIHCSRLIAPIKSLIREMYRIQQCRFIRTQRFRFPANL